VIDTRLERFGLSIRPGIDFDLINPEDDPRYRDYVQTYVERAGRRGVTPELARTLVRTTPTVIAALAVIRGDADTMLCGVEGRFIRHLRHIRSIIGVAPGVRDFAALSMLLTPKGAFFMGDTQITLDPSAEDLAEMAQLAAVHVKRFGIEPKVALLSHSDFGSRDDASALKMRRALELVLERSPGLMVDGEMEGDSALVPEMRERVMPGSRLQGVANILLMPNLDAANIGYQMVKVFGDSLPVGPILLGTAQPAHIMTPSVTARGVVNMTALAVVEAQAQG